MADDATLLRQYAEGDEAAFSAFVAGHIDFVYASALRRVGGDRHLAEDIVQQVFFASARHAHRLASHPALSGWLFTTTRNVAAQMIRGERRRRKREQDALTMENASPPTHASDWGQLQHVLEMSLDQLATADRNILVMRHLEEQGFAEIGRQLKLSEDGARMRATRAMEKLREILARHGITSTAAALASTLTAHASPAAPAGLTAEVARAAMLAVKLGQGASLGSGLGWAGGSKAIFGVGAAVTLAVLGVVGISRGLLPRSASGPPVEANSRSTPLLTQEPPAPYGSTTVTRMPETQSEPRRADAQRSVPPRQATADNPEARRILEEITYAQHTDPELLRLRVELAQSEFPLRYASLYRAWGLSSVQIAELERLLAERAAGRVQLMAEKFTRHLTEDDPRYLELRARYDEKLGRPLENAMRAILTDPGYVQLETLAAASNKEPDLPLVTLLALADTPLTPEQTLQLAEAVGTTDLQKIVSHPAAWESAQADLQRILHSHQLEWLHAFRTRERLRREISQRETALRSQIFDAALQR